jgi:hypothetical protein
MAESGTNAKIDELKTLVSGMNQTIALNKQDSDSKWEVLKTSTEGKLDTVTLKIDTLQKDTDKRFDATDKRFDSNANWTRWGVGIAATSLFGLAIFTLNNVYQSGVTNGKVTEVSNQVGNLQRSVEGRFDKVQISLDKLAVNQKPDDPALTKAVADLPSRFDRMDQRLDAVAKIREPLPYDRITFDGFTPNQQASSGTLLEAKLRIYPTNSPIRVGLYTGRFPNPRLDESGSKDLFVRQDIATLPTRIVLMVSNPDQATASMQFANPEDLRMFLFYITSQNIKPLIIDISGERLDRQLLDHR